MKRASAFVLSTLVAACGGGAARPAASAQAPAPASATEGSPPTPVEQEPLHHVVLKNESVVVIHLTLPPGERTLYHTHTHDRVAVHLSRTSITQQKPDELEGAASATSPGTFSAMTLEGRSYTHRVHNVGSEAFEVLDVELLERPRSPSPAAAAAVAAETLSTCRGDGACSENHGARRAIVYPRDEGGGLSMGGQQGGPQPGQRRELRRANLGDRIEVTTAPGGVRRSIGRRHRKGAAAPAHGEDRPL